MFHYTEWHCFSWALINLFVLQVTNQVTRDSSTGPLKPALGRSWSFVPSTRVLLESKEATWEKATRQRVASLAKSPRQVRLPGSIPWECRSSCGTWPWLLWEWGRTRPRWVSPGSGRGARAAWLDAAEEKSICSQQPGLVFKGRINEWQHFQSRSLCS